MFQKLWIILEKDNQKKGNKKSKQETGKNEVKNFGQLLKQKKKMSLKKHSRKNFFSKRVAKENMIKKADLI